MKQVFHAERERERLLQHCKTSMETLVKPVHRLQCYTSPTCSLCTRLRTYSTSISQKCSSINLLSSLSLTCVLFFIHSYVQVMDLDQNKVCTYPRVWTDYINYIIVSEVVLLLLLISKVSYDYWIFRTAGYLPWPASKMPKMPCDCVLETWTISTVNTLLQPCYVICLHDRVWQDPCKWCPISQEWVFIVSWHDAYMNIWV